MTALSELAASLSAHGLKLRGAFHVGPDDIAPEGAATIALVGNAGPSMWEAFAKERRDEPHSLDAWTKRVVGKIAEDFGALGIYPSDGPPYYPFQRWATKAEPIHTSPIGIAIHPEYGLWHAYRAAIAFDSWLELPARKDAPSPCNTCEEKPCLSTCPVNAFSGHGYDVPACIAHLKTPTGKDCMTLGCRARRSCPVGHDYHYDPAQAEFHMLSFFRAHP